jgi:addiction module HigA family antidote
MAAFECTGRIATNPAYRSAAAHQPLDGSDPTGVLLTDPAVHPGEVLAEDFLKPLGLSQYRLANDIHVPAMRISQIVRGQRVITADTAYRLALYFGGDAGWWLRLQAQYDMEALSQDGDRLQREVQPNPTRPKK